ncbi:MAG: type II secretion system protein N [Burkholderiaceae bacterium]
MRSFGWLVAGCIAAWFTALSTLPAAWLAPLIEQQSSGYLSLAEVDGSLWNGSAVIATSTTRDGPLTPLLPGRLRWQISPSLLLGRVDIALANPSVTQETIRIRGNWSNVDIGAGSLNLPADGLSALGAPLNTLKPTGLMKVAWQSISLNQLANQWQINTKITIDLMQVASALSPVKPLGSYRLQFDWFDHEARLNLQSLSGPLLIEGRGRLVDGRLKFTGQASAEAGFESRLNALLVLLGQRRQIDGRSITVLEF